MRKKNNVETFLASPTGARLFNIFYSWGASVVIIGAMFHVVHLPYANQIFMVGMIVEALVFFVWGFANPDVAGKDDDTQVSSVAISGGVAVSGAMPQSSGGGIQTTTSSKNISVSPKDLESLSGEIGDLNNASGSLVESYQRILNNTEGLSVSSEVFAKNIEVLNQHVSGLNKIYETQLLSITDQMAAVKHTNESLERIKNMYSEAVFDSSAFKRETEKMTKNIEALNGVYSRLLDAMTTSSHLRS